MFIHFAAFLFCTHIQQTFFYMLTCFFDLSSNLLHEKNCKIKILDCNISILIFYACLLAIIMIGLLFTVQHPTLNILVISEGAKCVHKCTLRTAYNVYNMNRHYSQHNPHSPSSLLAMSIPVVASLT